MAPRTPKGSAIVYHFPCRAHIVAHEGVGASRRKYYVTYKDNISASKVYDDFPSSDICSLRPHGSIPAEFGSWLNRLCAGALILIGQISVANSLKTHNGCLT